jgi:hypothetical protein
MPVSDSWDSASLREKLHHCVGLPVVGYTLTESRLVLRLDDGQKAALIEYFKPGELDAVVTP